MAAVIFRLPKLHVYFKTDKAPGEVRKEILGPLANGYESFVQTMLNNAGETGLTAKVIRKRGKIFRDGDRWGAYLKCIIEGETDRKPLTLRQAWANRKSSIKSQIKSRLERAAFGGTEVRFNFKRLDGQEAQDES